MISRRRGGHVFVIIQSEPAVLSIPLSHNAMPLAQPDRLEGSEGYGAVAQVEAQFYVTVEKKLSLSFLAQDM